MSQACGRMSPWLIIRESKNPRLTYLALLKKPQFRPQQKKGHGGKLEQRR